MRLPTGILPPSPIVPAAVPVNVKLPAAPSGSVCFSTINLARLVLVKVQVVVLPAWTVMPVTPVAPGVPVAPPPCSAHDGVPRYHPVGTVSLTLKPLPGRRLLTV